MRKHLYILLCSVFIYGLIHSEEYLGSGSGVKKITAADSSITIGGTNSNPTIAATAAPASSKFFKDLQPLGGMPSVTQFSVPANYQFEVSGSSEIVFGDILAPNTTNYRTYLTPINTTGGGDFALDIDFMSTGTVSGTSGVVKLFADVSTIGSGDNYSSVSINRYTLTQTIDSTTPFIKSSATITITGSNFVAGKQCKIKVGRASGKEDTFTGSIFRTGSALREK